MRRACRAICQEGGMIWTEENVEALKALHGEIAAAHA
jgi:hypothetical protein